MNISHQYNSRYHFIRSPNTTRRQRDHFIPQAIMPKVTHGTKKSCTGLTLKTTQYIPDDSSPPLAVLCFHHGLQEHSGRYANIFSTMADQGIAVYTYDALGHGQSEGDRSLVNQYGDLITDLQAIVEDASSSSSSSPATTTTTTTPVPFFIAGHSLGGLIATLTCLRDQSRWSGLLLSDPAIDVEWTPVLRMQAAVGNLLSALVPKARIVPATQPEKMNKDPEKVKEYVEDPLNDVGSVAARTANETLKAFRELGKRRSELKVPLYAHHGTDDKVTSFTATKYVFFFFFLLSFKCTRCVPT